MSKRTLVCMRRTNMSKIHPGMSHDECDECREVVGIYPSGQAFINTAGRQNVKILCEKCVPTGIEGVPLPGVLKEMKESVVDPWKKKK